MGVEAREPHEPGPELREPQEPGPELREPQKPELELRGREARPGEWGGGVEAMEPLEAVEPESGEPRGEPGLEEWSEPRLEP